MSLPDPFYEDDDSPIDATGFERDELQRMVDDTAAYSRAVALSNWGSWLLLPVQFEPKPYEASTLNPLHWEPEWFERQVKFRDAAHESKPSSYELLGLDECSDLSADQLRDLAAAFGGDS